MKRFMPFLLLFAIPALSALDEISFARRVRCEVQNADGRSLDRLTFQQGTTPLISCDVFRNGRPISIDTTVQARVLIGSSATASVYVVATNYAVTNNSYLVQLPTIGTNSAAAENGLWWYTVYFDRDGQTFWTGNGELVIEKTTSTADGIVWQEITTSAAVAAHTTESSNTVHGGFIKTAYDWATNAYTYAGLAWHQATNALAIAQAEGIFSAWLGTNTYVKVEADTLQSVVTRSGTVTAGDVTVDEANERTNTYGGYIVKLGTRIQQPECTASGGAGAIALGVYSVASGTNGAMALGENTTASGNSGATALGLSTIASGDLGATALGDSTTARGLSGATALGYLALASGDLGATALGYDTTASGNNGATALGFSSIASNDSSFAWGSSETPYGSHGIGSFNINPIGGLSGFWIGETNFAEFLDLYVPKALTNDWEVGSHESFLTTNGSGSGLTGITAAQVGAVPTSRTITVNGQVGSLESNVAFTVEANPTLQDVLDNGNTATNGITLGGVIRSKSPMYLDNINTSFIICGFGTPPVLGTRNTGFGGGVFFSSAGNYNTAFGEHSVYGFPGSYNVGVGGRTLSEGLGGSGNTAIGYYSMYGSSGSYNTMLGYFAGSSSRGVSNIYVGANAAYTNAAYTNAIVLGAGSSPLGNNSMLLGNDETTNTVIKGNVGIGTNNPSQKLEVAGSVKAQDRFYFGNGASLYASGSNLFFVVPDGSATNQITSNP